MKTLLIANRGEIACRIMRTSRALGIRTVAVYSETDANAQHVVQADAAIALAGETAAETYLDIEQIVSAAITSGADAIHPGYGFLSENAAFAAACEQANVIFVGPPASAIEAMGSKAVAKDLMRSADVPLLPGEYGTTEDIDRLRELHHPWAIQCCSKQRPAVAVKACVKLEATVSLRRRLRPRSARLGRASVMT